MNKKNLFNFGTDVLFLEKLWYREEGGERKKRVHKTTW